MSDIDVAALRARTLVLPDEYWAHEGDCGGSLCEGCGHCLHSLSPACDHKCGGGPGGCGDFVMTDEVRYRLDVLALLDRLAAAEAAVERVRNLRDEWHDGLRDVAVYETGYELSQVLTETIEGQP